MLKAVDVSEEPLYAKFLIYGPQGEGKTTWAAENLPSPTFLDFERSTDSLITRAKRDPEFAKKMESVKIVHVTPQDKPADVEAFCRDFEKKSDSESLVFDTISTSQIFQLGSSIADKRQDHPLIQDYRDSTQIFNNIFLRLQHIKKHVVLIAHERTVWEGDLSSRKKVAIGPNVTPALQDSVTQLVSGVFRLQRKQAVGKDAMPTWSMLINSKGLYLAKNRYGLTQAEIDNPTWDTFMKGTL